LGNICRFDFYWIRKLQAGCGLFLKQNEDWLTFTFACALYVGVGGYGTPQEWLRAMLLFGVATSLYV
jgi:hypothetical protein